MGSIIVWNVCGLGGREKKRCLRNLGRKFDLHILGILETKLETLNDFTITAIWGRHPRAWYAVPSLGLSGGILCIWNPDLFCVSSCSVAMNGRILHIEGTFTQSNLDCLVSFVYAPNGGNLKNELWTYLVTFRDSVSKPWCLAGDFNETLFPSDRKGSSQITSSMTRFKNCIDGCNLMELPLNGRKFTWSRGNAASRIDRIFVSGDWLQTFPSSTLFGLSKYSSDHRPLHLLLDSTNWGPKPFRFMNCWWLVSDFRNMIQSFWSSIMVSKSGSRKMVPALKMLKERCRQWSKANMGSMNNRIAELELEADSMDRKNECRVLSADELIRSNSIASRLKILYRAQESV
jgi:exonuclease III